MKNCSSCQQEKEVDSFYSGRKTKDGYSSACISCTRNSARVAQRKFRYGISDEEFNERIQQQGNACATCGTDFGNHNPRPEVDHDRSCCPGKKTCGQCIRGILCHKCIVMAGGIEYNIEYLDDVLRYLTFHLLKRHGGTIPAGFDSLKSEVSEGFQRKEVNNI